MIKTLAASKAAKLLATCVCPVAGTVALTVAVPQVRSAVHKATAPREHAKPKTRVRPQGQYAALQPPCLEVGPALTAQSFRPFDEEKEKIRDDKNPDDKPPPVIPSIFPPPEPGVPLIPPPTPVAAIPEPKTWVQLLLGFGIVGAVMRTGKRRDEAEAEPAEQADG